jgi:hypothetical protein
MVLEQDGLMAAVINLDWICIEEDLVERIRQGSPFQYTLCCSVSNGSVSYLPTREARHRGGYECWVGRAGGAYLLADTIDDALVEQNLKLLRK